jgi:hypothetical protein
VRGQRHASAALYPGKYTVPIVQKADWASGPVCAGAESLASPPGFDPWTVQPAASRYTNHDTRPTKRGIAVIFTELRHQVGMGSQRHALVALAPGKRPGSHYTKRSINRLYIKIIV